MRGFIADALLDLRMALRRVRRAPSLAIGIVLTIGVGLGSAAAIFAATDAALRRPLPFADSDRLAHLGEVRVGTGEESPTSYPTLLDWRTGATAFSQLEGYNPMNAAVGLADEGRMLRGAQVTTGFFRLLGLPLHSGRDFRADEAAPAAPAVAIVSERFARTSLGDSALGRRIAINGDAYQVVGVLSPEFQFATLQDADVFVPLVADTEMRTDRTDRGITVVGRLRDGASLREARAQLTAVMSSLARDNPETMVGRSAVAVPLRDALLGNMKAILIGLAVAVSLLLVAMATNLALLMLTRHVERRPELAMRSALGATRGRILRQLLVESLLLSLAGGALALFVADTILYALVGAIPDILRIGMPFLAGATLDRWTIVLIVGLAGATAVGIGLGPALMATRPASGGPEGRATPARKDRRIRQALVTAQMALTVLLLVASGLLVVSLRRVVQRDVGFIDPERLVAARVSLSGSRYDSAAAQQQFFEELLVRAGAVPGMERVAAISQLPGGGGGMSIFETLDQTGPAVLRPRAAVRLVGGDYFGTMGIPIVAGRAFEEWDRPEMPPVAVISEGFADLLRQDGRALGRRFRLSALGDREWEVVGIVGEVQVAALDADSPPTVYLSHLQAAENRMSLVVRTGLEGAAVEEQIRDMVTAIDPSVPVYAVGTVYRRMRESRAVFSRQFPLILFGSFAAAALALALVALYATTAHHALSRRREFGIRLALGCKRSAILRMILREGLLLAAAGIGVGGVAALLVSRSMQALLYGVAGTDWRVYALVAAAALLASLLATLRPALRAASVDPSIVMREL